MQDERYSRVECILFVSGEPVSYAQLQQALGMSRADVMLLVTQMDADWRAENRGILLHATDETVQLVSNREFAPMVEELLQPAQTKSFSQAMLETLSVVAYRQPVTRSDIEAVRGVRCDYTVSQLLKLDMIRELGRKEALGRPMLFGTTDRFLREFGIRSVDELPEFVSLADQEVQPETLDV